MFRFCYILSKSAVVLSPCALRPRGYKTLFMLNSTEHDELSIKFFLLIYVKMPTNVGILTFMNRKNSILGLSESGNAEFLDIFKLMNN